MDFNTVLSMLEGDGCDGDAKKKKRRQELIDKHLAKKQRNFGTGLTPDERKELESLK